MTQKHNPLIDAVGHHLKSNKQFLGWEIDSVLNPSIVTLYFEGNESVECDTQTNKPAATNGENRAAFMPVWLEFTGYLLAKEIHPNKASRSN